jgi:DNA ligase-1
MMDIQTLNDYCAGMIESISAESSRTKKESIIAEVATVSTPLNRTFFKLVQLALDPRVRFNTRTLPEVGHPEFSTVGFDECIAILGLLSGTRGTDNDVIAANMFSRLSARHADVIGKVLLKNLRIGATATTFNKFMPGLVYTHPYMRCSSFDLKFFGKHISLPCFSQLKADGRYLDVVVDADGVKYQARSGLFMDIESPWLDYAYSKYPSKVFMGEMIALDENGVEYPREKSNGMLNSDEIVEELAKSNRIRVYHWDVVELDEWLDGESKTPYSARLSQLQDIVSSMGTDNISVIECKLCSNVDDVIDHFTEQLMNGKEGTVVKDLNLGWSSGTSKQQMKVKVEFDCDLQVVGTKEGKGKHVGRLGSIQCQSADGLLSVSVAGFTDKEREQLWEARDQIVGKILVVKSNGILPPTDLNDTYSLFLPRNGGGIRDDKDTSDTLQRVQEQFDAFVETFRQVTKTK